MFQNFKWFLKVDQYKLVFEGTSLQNSSKPKICSTAFTVVYFHPFPTKFDQEQPALRPIPWLYYGQILDNLMDNGLRQWRRDRARQLTVFSPADSHCHIKALNPRPLGNNSKWQEQITLGTKASTEPQGIKTQYDTTLVLEKTKT